MIIPYYTNIKLLFRKLRLVILEWQTNPTSVLTHQDQSCGSTNTSMHQKSEMFKKRNSAKDLKHPVTKHDEANLQGSSNHRPQSRQVTGARCTDVAAHQSRAEYMYYSSRPTTGAEQRWMRWLRCLIRTLYFVNFQFQFHTQITYKPTYMTHDTYITHLRSEDWCFISW